MAPELIHYDHLVACHECDAIHEIVSLNHGQKARCTRCNALLYKEIRNSLDKTLGFAITGFVLFIIANSFPLMNFRVQGRSQDNTLLSGAIEFFQVGFWELGILVFLVSILMPLLYLSSVLYVLIPIKFGYHAPGMTGVFKLADQLRPWAMAEVFMLGALVAIVKLSDFATVTPGTALYALTALIIVLAAVGASFDARIVWRRIEIKAP